MSKTSSALRKHWHKLLLGALALGATYTFLCVWGDMAELTDYNDALQVRYIAPRGIQSLTLSSGHGQAAAILEAWTEHEELINKARLYVETDQRFVWHYSAFLALLASFGCGWIYLGRQYSPIGGPGLRPLVHWSALVIGVTLLAGADVWENNSLEKLFDGSARFSLFQLRIAGQVKFILLALVSLALLMTFLMAIRRQCRYRAWAASPDSRSKTARVTSSGSFQALVTTEQQRILRARGRKFKLPEIRFEAANEPWVARCNEDFVGLALSGGGIRSATFNLGLLQGLHRLNLLGCVDYLATVSGGGYIGGFWSRWLKDNAENGTAPKEPFPDKLKESSKNFAGDSRVFEAKEVRHLREFGKFLVPRIGIFDTETWGGVVALLAAAGASILAALSVLGLSLIGWLLLTFYLACPDGWGRMSFASHHCLDFFRHGAVVEKAADRHSNNR